MDKGETFELKAFEALSQSLKNNRLGLLPSACKIFHRKGYASRDRGKDIQIDVSIELHLPGAPTWSLLWAWECKDYKRHIPVDDIEEFWAKLTQIGGMNVKGGFVVSGALQESALNFAKAKGIAVVRLLPENQIDQILWDMSPGPELSAAERAENRRVMVMKALTDPEYRANRQQFFGLCNTNAVFDWSSLVESALGEADDIQEIAGIFCQRIDDVFKIEEKVAVCGRIEIGKILPEQRVTLLSENVRYVATVSRIESFRILIKEASAGDYVCLFFSDLPQGVINRDFVVVNDKAIALLGFSG